MSSKKAKQARKSQRDELASLKRKLQQGPLGDKPVVFARSGEVKMSEVLGDFVAPYCSSANTENTRRMLLTLGALAWNTSLLPDDQQEDMINQTLTKGVPTATDQERTELLALLHALIARRKAFFSEHKRWIVSLDYRATGNGYQLSVASAPLEA